MSDTTVSVAMATRNGMPFLKEQLDSIFQQTYPNIEVVVSDDCSDDGTQELLEKYKQLYGLRYFVNQEPLGFVKNFERAIRLCKGQLIALCDQDDVWVPEKIEVLVREIGGYSLIHSPSLEMIREGRRWVFKSESETYGGRHRDDYCGRWGTGKPTMRLIAENWVVSHQIMFTREVVERALPIPAGQLYHDAWLAVVASTLNGLRYIEQPLTYYRTHEESVTYRDLQPPRGVGAWVRAVMSEERRWRRSERIKSEIHRLAGVADACVFGETEKQFIRKLIMFYRRDGRFSQPLYRLIFAARNARLFYYNDGLIRRLAFIVKTLL
jgi:glycosyltransferase involved in cell wall biosynthesis